MSTASSNVTRGWFGKSRRERQRIQAELAAETARFEAGKEEEIRLPRRPVA